MASRSPTLPQTGSPARRLLVLWPTRALFVGDPYNLSPHRAGVAVVCVGLDADLSLGFPSAAGMFAYRDARCVLVPAGAEHHVVARGSVAFIYLDPASRDARDVADRLAARAADPEHRPGHLEPVVSALRRLLDGGRPDAAEVVLTALGLSRRPIADGRVAAIVSRLREDPDCFACLADAARSVDWSGSRLQHRFKQDVGLPYRRFRLWSRLRIAVRAACSGASWTQAAHTAGLASSAHLTRTFHTMFGLRPTDLQAGTIRLLDRPVTTADAQKTSPSVSRPGRGRVHLAGLRRGRQT